MIQVKKWCNPTKQSEIRYYISGLKGMDAQRNPAIEIAKNGTLNIFSRFGKDPGITLQSVLQQLFGAGLISTQEPDDITIDTLDRLAGMTKANANNHASPNRVIQIEPIALLCAVDGIGKKTAESIAQILNKNWLGENHDLFSN